MPGPTHVLEIRTGDAVPEFQEFEVGQARDPMSIGRAGHWSVDAIGMLDVHGFIYWDGTDLFVQSADRSSPVKANGQRIPAEWTKVNVPSTLAMGEARVVFCRSEEARDRRPGASRGRSSAGTSTGSVVLEESVDEEATQMLQRPDIAAIDAKLKQQALAAAPTPKPAPVASPVPAPARVAPARVSAATPPPARTAPRRTPTLVSSVVPSGREQSVVLPASEVDSFQQTSILLAVDPQTGSSRAAPHSPVPLQQNAHAELSGIEEDDNESTRTLPVPELRPQPIAFAPAPPPPPAANASQNASPGLSFTPPPFVPPGFPAPPAPYPVGLVDPPPPPPPPAPIAEPPKPAPSKAKDGFGAQWKALSIPKKITLFLLPVGFVMVFLAFDEDDGPTNPSKPAASASASKRSKKSDPDDDDRPKKKPDDDDSPRKKPKDDSKDDKKDDSKDDKKDDDRPRKKVDDTPRVIPAPPRVIPSASASTSTGKPAPSSSAPPERSLERAAADAVAAGQWAKAAKLYEALAKEQPDNEAFKEAAKILKAKAARKGE